MSWVGRLLGFGPKPTTTTPAGASTAPAVVQDKSPTSPANSPLKPAFDRSGSKFPRQVQAAIAESQSLAEGYKACLMEVGVANAKGAPTFYGYGTHKPMTMNLTKALPGERLDLTVCLNVSGHDFKGADGKHLPDIQQRVEERAKNNRYVIQVTHPDGKVDKMTGIEAKGAISTAQDISINMKPGKTIVEAWPEGSAGVGGYVEGRRLEISYQPPGRAADSFG